MGITGLIPFLDKSSSKIHLKDLGGTTVAVDSYCWLHKGVFSCAEKLVRGEETYQYLYYCLKYVTLLLSYNIKPIMVFDGQHLPAKSLTEHRRRESRHESKKKAAELLRQGRTEEARSHMRRCVDVTHEMALLLIKECRKRNVDCIVAPYEADAQMAWLNKASLAEYVITEDSDLTLFGARKIIFKLDLNGSGLLVESNKFHLAMGCTLEKYNFDKFRRMCILSGCDYLDSLPGIGLAKSCKFFLKTEEGNMWRALKKIPQYLNLKKVEVSDDYIENFLKAEATFKYMYIYNPLKRKMERLNEVADIEMEKRFCTNAGNIMEDDEQSFNLALGNLNPLTLKKLDNWLPNEMTSKLDNNFRRIKHNSIWHENCSLNENEISKYTPENNSCSFFFKKLSFEKEVDNTIRSEEETSNEHEADIYKSYKIEADNLRASKEMELNSSENNLAISTIRNLSCNPFAKLSKTFNASTQIPNTNASFLKILSPKKNEEESASTNLSIRSRFFKKNLSLCNEESKSMTTLKTELVHQKNNTLSSKNDQLIVICEDSSPETIQNTNFSEQSNENFDECNGNAIIKNDNKIWGSTTNKKHMTQKRLRLGLSKIESTNSSIYKKKTVTTTENQTRLSMFGFQKRPKLK